MAYFNNMSEYTPGFHRSTFGSRSAVLVLLVVLLWAATLLARAAPPPHVNHHLVRREVPPPHVNHHLVRREAPPPHVNHRLVRREATSPPDTTDSQENHSGAPLNDPPPDARQVDPPGGVSGTRGQRGASPALSTGGGQVDEVGKEEPQEDPGSTANLAQPVEGGAGGSDSLHPGIIVVLSLVCVFLFVLIIVCTAALIRYTVVQKKKGRHSFPKHNGIARPDSCLWAEGARYSPATPGTFRPRRKDGSKRTHDKEDLTRASHISTELYRAVYPYSPTEVTQLRLEPGLVVDVVEKTDGWWRGFAGPEEGWFPANYVERVYEAGSCATLDDYTDDMGGRHSRHLRPAKGGDTSRPSSTITTNTANNTNNITQSSRSNSNSTRSSGLGVSTRGRDHSDFQMARRPRPQPPKPPVSPVCDVTHPDGDVTQPMVPQHDNPENQEDAATFVDESTLGRPRSGDGSSGGEENLLQSIFSDLEKVWSKSQVSTPIDKDYYKLQPLDSSLQPIPLSDSFGEEIVNKKRIALDCDDTPNSRSNALIPTDTQNQNEAEDTYMNCREERHILEAEEDMYINCQAERHEAVKDEEVAQDEMDGVAHGFDKILQDLVGKEQELEVEEVIVIDLPPAIQQTTSPIGHSPSDTTNPLDVSYRAMYSYVPRQQDELSITADELLTHVSHVSDDWVKVRNGSGEEGLVPVIYVAPKDPNSPQHQGGRPPLHRSPETPDSDEWDVNDFDNDMEGDVTAIEYIALYDYKSQQEGDLELQTGDRVAVLETVESGWWKGYSNGREGWFPAAYVQMCAESTPNTPAATMTSPFAHLAQLGIIQNDVKSPHAPERSSSSGSEEEEDEDVPPPLPTCPPPTDEELEELELKLREQSEQVQREKEQCRELLSAEQQPEDIEAEDFLKPVASAPVVTDNHQRVLISEGRNGKSVKDIEVVGSSVKHGIAREVVAGPVSDPAVFKRSYDVVRRPEENGEPRGRGAGRIEESDTAMVGSESEPSPPRVLRPPVGFGGSDIGLSTESESEPERFRFKFGKRFGKPKFVKIPKKILPQMRRVGSAGKRPAPPAPAHARLEISAPILQQSSDPMRIAASQDVVLPRVSFQEPVEKGPNSDAVETTGRESPQTNSPGILKNRKVLIYKSPHGGSYEDVMAKGHNNPISSSDNQQQRHIGIYDVPPQKPRPVSQVSTSSVRSNSSRGSDRYPQRQSVHSSDRNTPSNQNQTTSPTARSVEKKTPPPRPRPISGAPTSAPHPGSKATYRPPLKQSMSLTHSPTAQHYSSGAIYRQSSVGGNVQGGQEFIPGSQPIRRRRRSHRPSAPPPPRPKMPPPPRPPGPPPGQVGAHGDGVHPDHKRFSGHLKQKEGQWIELNGLDSTQTSTDIITQPLVERGVVISDQVLETMNKSVSGHRVANTRVKQDTTRKGYVELHEEDDQGQPGNLTFTVNKGILRTRKDVPLSTAKTGMSSHLTKSPGFDVVDFPGPGFEVITMTNQSKRLNAGPRDSFRKYKKQVGGSKRTSLNDNVVDIIDGYDNEISTVLHCQQTINNAQMQARKAKSQSLPYAPGSRSVSMRGEELYAIHHHNKPRSLTLGRSECVITGPPTADQWSSPLESPSKRNAPPRPPPPAVSPGSPQKKFPPTMNGDAPHSIRCEKPVKPPRKDKLRRSTEAYVASEKGELSFDEDMVIKDIGEVSMPRSISTNASEPPQPAADIVWI